MKSIDQGIFLNRKSYSDTSLITTFYTKKTISQNGIKDIAHCYEQLKQHDDDRATRK